jgi:hypothetical protein
MIVLSLFVAPRLKAQEAVQRYVESLTGSKRTKSAYEHAVREFAEWNSSLKNGNKKRFMEEIDKAHSEFRYGAFSRKIVLPAGADEEHVQASYDKGILEVVIDLREKEAKRAGKRIPVKAG